MRQTSHSHSQRIATHPTHKMAVRRNIFQSGSVRVSGGFTIFEFLMHTFSHRRYIRQVRIMAAFLLILTLGSVARAQTFGPGFGANTDAYGGYTKVQCPSGAASHFYTQKIGNRWWVCDPAGNGFIVKGLTTLLDNINTNFNNGSGAGAMFSQFGPGQPTADPATNWYYSINQRMQGWGFNAIMDESTGSATCSSDNSAFEQIPGNSSNPYNPIKMPYVYSSVNISAYAMGGPSGAGSQCGISNWNMKDLTGAAGAYYNTYYSYPYNTGDYFDPNWPQCILNQTTWLAAAWAGACNAYALYATIDETDETGTITNAGPDFPTSPTGHNATNAAWIILNSSPSIAAAPVHDISYDITYYEYVNHSKLQFANNLLNEYLGVAQGTYSIDPAAGNYAGSTRMATATAALNAAWGSSFTTLSTSDSHCTTNLAVCLGSTGTQTYNSWAAANCKAVDQPLLTCTGVGTGTGTKGTGLLDEDGSDQFVGDPCSLGITNTAPQSCGSPSGAGNYTQAETPAMQADMNTELYNQSVEFFSTQATGWHTGAPGVLLHLGLGAWNAPPRKQVLQAAQGYLTLPDISGPNSLVWDSTQNQQRIDFISEYWGDHPYIMGFVGQDAQEDSSEAQWPNYASGYPSDLFTTQPARGAGYATNIAGLLNAISTTYTNDYQIAGWFWYGWTDFDNQYYDWGPTTVFGSPYDGHSGTAAGTYVDQYGHHSVSEQVWPAQCLNSSYPYPGCTGAGTASWAGPKLPQNLACTASAAPYSWCTGLYTGTAQGNYGDSIDAVTSANLGVYQLIAPIVVARPGGIF